MTECATPSAAHAALEDPPRGFGVASGARKRATHAVVLGRGSLRFFISIFLPSAAWRFPHEDGGRLTSVTRAVVASPVLAHPFDEVRGWAAARARAAAPRTGPRAPRPRPRPDDSHQRDPSPSANPRALPGARSVHRHAARQVRSRAPPDAGAEGSSGASQVRRTTVIEPVPGAGHVEEPSAGAPWKVRRDGDQFSPPRRPFRAELAGCDRGKRAYLPADRPPAPRSEREAATTPPGRKPDGAGRARRHDAPPILRYRVQEPQQERRPGGGFPRRREPGPASCASRRRAVAEGSKETRDRSRESSPSASAGESRQVRAALSARRSRTSRRRRQIAAAALGECALRQRAPAAIHSPGFGGSVRTGAGERESVTRASSRAAGRR